LDRLWLHFFAMLREEWADVGICAKGAQRPEDFVYSAQVRVSILDDAPQCLERAPLTLQYRSYAAIQGQHSKIGAPGNPNCLEAPVRAWREYGRIGRGTGWIAGVGTRHHGKQIRCIRNGPGDGSLDHHTNLRKYRRCCGHKSDRGSKAHDIVEVSRIANGA